MNVMRIMIAIFAVVFGVFANGCMLKRVTEPDMIGKYKADLPGGGFENLELFRGGVCTQEIRMPDGKMHTARGTWRYDGDRKRLFLKGTRQSLTPTQEINPKLDDPPTDAVLATPVSRNMSGNVTIMMNEDIDYKKQN